MNSMPSRGTGSEMKRLKLACLGLERIQMAASGLIILDDKFLSIQDLN